MPIVHHLVPQTVFSPILVNNNTFKYVKFFFLVRTAILHAVRLALYMFHGAPTILIQPAPPICHQLTTNALCKSQMQSPNVTTNISERTAVRAKVKECTQAVLPEKKDLSPAPFLGVPSVACLFKIGFARVCEYSSDVPSDCSVLCLSNSLTGSVMNMGSAANRIVGCRSANILTLLKPNHFLSTS